MELVGFRLRLFPMRHPFYCLQCATDACAKQGWVWKTGYGRKASIPIVRTDSGLVRHVKIGGSLRRRQWYIQDEEVIANQALFIEIVQKMAYLGLRLIPSMPQEVSENVACYRCGTALAAVGLRETLSVFFASRWLLQMAGPNASHIRLGQLMTVKMWLFETGAVLGRARSAELETLAILLARPGREKDVATYLIIRADELMRSCERKEPATFFEFHQQVGNIDLEGLLKEGMKNVPLRVAHMIGQSGVVDGVGFGARYPDLTEAVYRRSYEQIDVDSWRRARAAGLDIPEHPEKVTLEERQHEVLLEVSWFASEYYPELVEPLGLRFT